MNWTCVILYLVIIRIITFTNPSYSQQRHPNIILILTDDQGWGDLSINGNTNINMPNIDKLAESGVAFDRFYVSPVCSPTSAELLTGRYHVRGGVYSTSAGGERLDLDETTICHQADGTILLPGILAAAQKDNKPAELKFTARGGGADWRDAAISLIWNFKVEKAGTYELSLIPQSFTENKISFTFKEISLSPKK